MNIRSLSITIALMFIAIGVNAQSTASYTDSRDGKSYKTVKIGKQVWMAENLRYKFSESTICASIESYGCYYSSEEALKACPSGWHLPSDAEWTKLTNFLGGEKVAGGKMKETGITNWQDPNTGATNESGFTALPAGQKGDRKYGSGFGQEGDWWSSTKCHDYDGCYFIRFVYYEDNNVERSSKHSGVSCCKISVRCLKDN